MDIHNGNLISDGVTVMTSNAVFYTQNNKKYNY